MLTLPDVAFKTSLCLPVNRYLDGLGHNQNSFFFARSESSRRERSPLQPLASSLIVSLARGQQGPSTGSTPGMNSPVIDFRYLPPPFLLLSCSHPDPSNASITVHTYHKHGIAITSCIRHCQAASRSRRRWRTRVWG